MVQITETHRIRPRGPVRRHRRCKVIERHTPQWLREKQCSGRRNVIQKDLCRVFDLRTNASRPYLQGSIKKGEVVVIRYEGQRAVPA